MSSLPQSYQMAHTFLKRAVQLVAVYGLGMVAAGEQLAIPIFDVFGFGPSSRGLNRNGSDYAVFAFGVLGSVLVGWMSLIGSMVELAAAENDASIRAKARRSLMMSTGIWFLFDTIFSLGMGEVAHAMFNIPFATLLGGPLYVMHKNDTVDKNKSI
ncbi:hypothetical protein IV203_016239 [Nitzschia inconspicua]|uniref:Uncharacterized protein n=1 Tax=Nitzschia inconspicua TaxID=303405 RepID=A0A9K3K8N4_9STRA|nr:hypothetical protein IV203_017454 [Nitzschia inconspicua]KAG7347534.1 hypothetical protein IV203_016239 [Nitzschia inconspicua]